MTAPIIANASTLMGHATLEVEVVVRKGPRWYAGIFLLWLGAKVIGCRSKLCVPDYIDADDADVD